MHIPLCKGPRLPDCANSWLFDQHVDEQVSGRIPANCQDGNRMAQVRNLGNGQTEIVRVMQAKRLRKLSDVGSELGRNLFQMALILRKGGLPAFVSILCDRGDLAVERKI